MYSHAHNIQKRSLATTLSKCKNLSNKSQPLTRVCRVCCCGHYERTVPTDKASVIQQKGDIKSIADVLELAKLAELVGLESDGNTTDVSNVKQLMDEVQAGREEVQQLTA